MSRRQSRRLPLVLAFVAIAAAVTVAVLANGAMTLALVSPQRGTAIQAVYATGTVEPVTWARIGPVTTGRIAEILADEGDAVASGQKLAQLDDREAGAKVTELQARAAYWREELDRARVLAARGIKSREAEDKARAEFDAAAAAIAAARQRRLDLSVVSPVDGIVLRRDGEIGEVVDAKDTLFWVGEMRPLRIAADVDEEDIARIRPGQEVLIKADAFPDAVLTGRIEQITPKGDPVNKTFRVRIALPDDTPLMIGMTAEINVITARTDNSLLVPATSVTDGKVLVVVDGRAETRTVRTGIKGRDQTEIVEGLNEGDVVVASPPAGLKPGERVRAAE